uniref:Uncharacterized protein n=1 Tax=viral metagenome TaxID=1070528 RepID=A0A6M3JBR5_9ZZZZ
MFSKKRAEPSPETMVISTIYLPERARNWIKEHGYQQSTFIRAAIEEKINRESGFQAQVEIKEKEITACEEQLGKLKVELKELQVIKDNWDKQQSIDNLDKTIDTAILKIQYANAVEVANDLKELRPPDMPWRDWLKKIAGRWKALKS